MERKVDTLAKTSLKLDRVVYYDGMHRARLLGYTMKEYLEVLLREDLRKPIEKSVAAIPGEMEVKV